MQESRKSSSLLTPTVDAYQGAINILRPEDLQRGITFLVGVVIA